MNGASGGTGGKGGFAAGGFGTERPDGSARSGTAGGILNAGTQVRPSNTIIAGNSADTNPNCFGTITDDGHNLEFNPTNTCGFTAGAPEFDVLADPVLGALAANGGPTQTMALGAGSAAIDTGDPIACAASPVSGKDQRGLARRSDRCSIGAFEADPLVVLGPASGTTAGGGTVRIAGFFVATGVQVTFGGVAATNVTVVDATTLTCTVPGHAAGAVDVTIANPSGPRVTLARAYTYGTGAPLPPPLPAGGTGSGLRPGPLPDGRPSSGGTGSPSPLPQPRP